MTHLTPEQQKIVQHNTGAALVYAVAGAGKTTCLKARTVRLVQEGLFRPERILATSFSRESVKDIQQKLSGVKGLERVQVKTLHSVGLAILKKAVEMGFLHAFKSEAESQNTRPRLLQQILREARLKGMPLDPFDPEDFWNYVGRCKAHLQYAEMLVWDFPEEGLKVASQAQPPEGMPHYLELYRSFEHLREREHFITFDDMTVLAWELCTRHPELLHEVGGWYDCLMVDEFQDLNLAQSELVHLLLNRHQNIMAFGDDDQTIYSWRGSSPEFILNFQERYGAKTYFITHNFRSRATHLALANFVISQNEHRVVKPLRLTQGFDGQTRIVGVNSQFEGTRDIADTIEHNLQNGMHWQDHAILVRSYALTPFLETELIERKIPYRIPGGKYFYKWDEILVLLNHLKVLQALDRLHSGEKLAPPEVRDLKSQFLSIAMNPRRFITRQYVQSLFVRLLGREEELLLQLQQDSQSSHFQRFQTGLQQLHFVLEELLKRVQNAESAQRILDHLLYYTNYDQHLQNTTADPELAEARMLGVRNLTRYAEGKGTAAEFLQHMEFMAFREETLNRLTEDRVLITTPYRAKGLEWPVVFVPGLNEGTLPAARSLDHPHLLEEERRVLYVAITRAREQLHLYHLDRDDAAPISRFLCPDPESPHAEQVLEEVQDIKAALETPEDTPLTLKQVHLLLNGMEKHHFGVYLQRHAHRHFDLDHLMVLSSKVLGAAQHLPEVGLNLQHWEAYGQGPQAVLYSKVELHTLKALFLQQGA